MIAGAVFLCDLQEQAIGTGCRGRQVSSNALLRRVRLLRAWTYANLADGWHCDLEELALPNLDEHRLLDTSGRSPQTSCIHHKSGIVALLGSLEGCPSASVVARSA